MTKKRALWAVAALGLVFCAEAGIGHTQETGPTKGGSQTEPAADTKQKSGEQKPLEAYHLDFAINELEDGKKINSRQYSLNMNSNDSGNEIKIGTKVPVEAKEGEF